VLAEIVNEHHGGTARQDGVKVRPSYAVMAACLAPGNDLQAADGLLGTTPPARKSGLSESEPLRIRR